MPIPYKVKLNNGNENIGAEAKTITVQEIVKNATNKDIAREVYQLNPRRGVLFMDEPEVSLHVEWQQRLIGLIRELNPNVQIVLTTHSPAMIMDGWEDAVTEVSDITTF